MSLNTSFCITAASVQGGRRYMEDRIHIECVRQENGSIDFLYAAVYDGHGGAQASEYARENLLEDIRSQKGFESVCDEEVLKAIKEGFLKTHENMQKESKNWPRTASGYSCTAGTTASCIFIRNGKIYVGHVGDSSVILGSKGLENPEDDCLKAKQLTMDHKPDNAAELSRIQFAGGSVLPKSGVSRVVWTRPIRGHRGPVRRSTPTEQIPFLAIARSLGDFWSYNDITEEFVVSPVPDVSVYKITPKDKCIFVVSDGVTNVMSPVSLMKSVQRAGFTPDEPSTRKNVNYAHGVLKSVLESWSFLRADNISIIMLEHESSSPNGLEFALISSEVPKIDLDEEFTKNPTAMVKISEKVLKSFPTDPVKLLYKGAIDKDAMNLKYSGPGFVTVERQVDSNENESPFLYKKRRDSIEDFQEVPQVSDEELVVGYEEENTGEAEGEDDGKESPAMPFSPYQDFPSSSNGYYRYSDMLDENYAYDNLGHSSHQNGLTDVYWDASEWTHTENRKIEFEEIHYGDDIDVQRDVQESASSTKTTINSLKLSNSQPSTSHSMPSSVSLSPLSASALSPVAMLQAIRASHEEMRCNSIIPQISRSKPIVKSGTYQSTASSAMVRKPPLKRPLPSEEPEEPETSEPPSKRSRFWNFITSMVRISPKMYKIN